MPRCALVLVLFVAVFATGGRSQPPQAGATPAISDEWLSAHGGADQSSTLVVRDAAGWTALWQQLRRDPPRAFDPAHEIAAAIFLGTRRTGGYGVQVVAVRRESDRLVLEYRERTPAPNARVAEMLTSPWTVVTITPPGLSVVFRKLSASASLRRDAP